MRFLLAWTIFVLFSVPACCEVEPKPAVLKIGFGQTDITPAVGEIITGAGHYRSIGIEDLLFAKTLVAQSGGRTIAIVGVDLIKIRYDLAEAAIALACERTGIEHDAVMICPSHNHSSPFIPMGGPHNKKYLETLPELIARSIEKAHNSLEPARMLIGRSLVYEGHHNRRVISKADGLVLNTWMKKLDSLEQTPQVLGTEGPIDPELWVARFDALDGRVLGVLVNFTCHPNHRLRKNLKTWSADFPGVIAEHITKAFGKQTVTVFTQGCSGNISPSGNQTVNWKEKSSVFGRAAVVAARRATPVKGPIIIDSIRRDIQVPRRDPKDQRPEAVTRLGWRSSPGGAAPRIHKVPVNAARIGPLGIATNPGELFVEWGLSIKKRSPFPHTIVSELTNEWIGYEPTARAFQHEGYESLAGVNFVTLEGIQKLVDTSVELLQELWKRDRQEDLR